MATFFNQNIEALVSATKQKHAQYKIEHILLKFEEIETAKELPLDDFLKDLFLIPCDALVLKLADGRVAKRTVFSAGFEAGINGYSKWYYDVAPAGALPY